MTRIGNGPRMDAVLRQATEDATDRLISWLNTRFTEEITTPKWPFPTPPKVRDIVNTGALLRSQRVTRTGPGEVSATWLAPYAAQAHEGGVGLNGMRFPGRPWTTAPLAESPERLNAFLKEALAERRP